MIPDGYAVVSRPPSVAEYRRLRVAAGLSARSEAASAAGLPNGVAAVVVERAGEAVGMGRVIGDGGLFFQVVDIAVASAHQGRGLGKAIMAALMADLTALAPAEAYVSLIADGEAHRLYAGFGFAPTAPASIGMARWLDGSPPLQRRG